MQNANMFLAQQRVLEARQQAAETRSARPSRQHPRKPRSLLDRLRGDF
jgi:hypothetical protein